MGWKLGSLASCRFLKSEPFFLLKGGGLIMTFPIERPYTSAELLWYFWWCHWPMRFQSHQVRSFLELPSFPRKSLGMCQESLWVNILKSMRRADAHPQQTGYFGMESRVLHWCRPFFVTWQEPQWPWWAAEFMLPMEWLWKSTGFPLRKCSTLMVDFPYLFVCLLEGTE